MKYIIVFILLFFIIFVTQAIVAKSHLSKCEIENFRNLLVAKNCYGTYVYTYGDKYIGEWTNYARDGQGTMIYADGGKYVGNWLKGERHAQGIITYHNSVKIDGYFNDGIFGNGIYKIGNIIDVWDAILFWYYEIVDFRLLA